MRLGIIDVGSNTVHLLVVDARPGSSPVPYHSQRSVLRLMRYLAPDESITEEGVALILTSLREAVAQVEEIQVDDLIVTVTSAIREAANGEEVLARVERETGLRPQVLSGEDEARITMLAVRRWLGWSAGEILLFDIGGGSFEIAQGADEYPDVQVSLPLGAGRSTINYLIEDPPPQEAILDLREHATQVFTEVRDTTFAERPKPKRVVGTSKTIRSLARLIGGPPDPDTGDLAPLHYAGLREWEPVMARMPSDVRKFLPGITPERAYQIMAGAVVLRSAMKVFKVPTLTISPWALREGIVLRYIDSLDSTGAEPPLQSSMQP
ncbi:Ppx/GppA phosphatase family protein [Leucobacter chinensis]|uniref:Ppx/GppA phosphatase family protein n=1 Tax=Leucobacter chinensis TaxID=2851010 RepID=UPI001C244DC3|nr:Ppx/GppA family phosphatase [Leucobacter chinensis]